MTVFVQLAGYWDAQGPDDAFRAEFERFVRGAARPGVDHVLLIEPDPVLAQTLRARWRWFPDVEIREVDVDALAGDVTPRTFYFARSATGDREHGSPIAWSRDSILRRFPNSHVGSLAPASQDLASLLEQASTLGDIIMLSVDGRRTPIRAFSAPALAKVRLTGVAVTIQDLTSAEQRAWRDLLRTAGFRAAGRPWGAAGSTMRFRGGSGLAQALRDAAAEARVQAGAAIVRVRDGALGPHARRARAARISTLRGTLHQSNIVDEGFGDRLEPIPLRVVERRIDDDAGADSADSPRELPQWQVDPTEGFDPWQNALECHDRHGVWPLSFSYPGPSLPIEPSPHRLVSPVIPGLPYAFDDARAYLEAYRSAYLGVTHRKAGWDCFRHVEILASGALPWMIDAADIPRFSMVHYPKAGLAAIDEAMVTGGGRPSDDTRTAFRSIFERHLTSKAMADYLLRAAGLDSAERIVFVDERLPHQTDYLSVMTLIGLKQRLGPACSVMYPVDYLYADTAMDTRLLYGRGFGYTRVLEPFMRSSAERGGPLELERADALVVGSVARNQAIAQELLKTVAPGRTIWIHGEDLPPRPDEVNGYRAAGVHVFVRAIHTSR